MNKRQIIILWSIAAALAAIIAVIKLSQKDPGQIATQRAAGQTLFKEFPARDVASVTIRGPKDSVVVSRKDDGWVVDNRDAYPANITVVNELLRGMADLKITRAVEAGPSFAPRFGMDEKATSAEDHGVVIEFRDAQGSDLAKVTLGKTIQGSSDPGMIGMGGPMAVGRYVRNHADDSGYYAVAELFPSFTPDANTWLRDTFLTPEKIKSVSVSKADSDELSWKVERETEESVFQLRDAAADEVANASNAARLDSVLAYARFDDVVPAAEVAQRSAATGRLKATLESFEGFRYDIGLVPSKESADQYLMTVAVSAQLPGERKKEANETEAQAKERDEAFTKRLTSLKDKLAEAKFFEGRTYLVSKSHFEGLLHSREQMVSKVQPPQASTPPIEAPPAAAPAAPAALTPPAAAPKPKATTRSKPKR